MAQPLDNPLGIIAGAGRFPFLVAEGARDAGRPVVIVALKGLASPELRDRADRFYWSGIVRLGRWIRLFRREGVREAIMAGYVRKSEMYGRFRLLRYIPDWTSFRLWFFGVNDRRNDTILRATADLMQSRGITLANSVQYCRDHMPGQGILTQRQPSPGVQKDIDFGWYIAKELGRLDIGQAVAVKEQEVIAVEAIEGTDRMIERAGQLCRHGGWTLIKVAKPNQDQRFDVPTVGPDTIDHLHRHGAAALVVEANQTLVIDRQALAARADKLGIVVVVHAAGGGEGSTALLQEA